jgi:chromosome segregation ATPase
MAKKSLTDLLREEVKKSSQPESPTVQETTDDEFIEQDAKTVEKSPMNTPAKSSAQRSNLTKAQLEATVTELKAALKEAQNKEATFADLKDSLEESHSKETALQQQITELQSELDHQNKSLHKLQKELEKLADLKTEAEQAKKAASHLAKANEKLSQEVDALKKENEDLKAHVPNQLEHRPGRPIQKETEKSGDFAKNSWLL